MHKIPFTIKQKLDKHELSRTRIGSLLIQAAKRDSNAVHMFKVKAREVIVSPDPAFAARIPRLAGSDLPEDGELYDLAVHLQGEASRNHWLSCCDLLIAIHYRSLDVGESYASE